MNPAEASTVSQSVAKKKKNMERILVKKEFSLHNFKVMKAWENSRNASTTFQAEYRAITEKINTDESVKEAGNLWVQQMNRKRKSWAFNKTEDPEARKMIFKAVKETLDACFGILQAQSFPGFGAVMGMDMTDCTNYYSVDGKSVIESMGRSDVTPCDFLRQAVMDKRLARSTDVVSSNLGPNRFITSNSVRDRILNLYQEHIGDRTAKNVPWKKISDEKRIEGWPRGYPANPRNLSDQQLKVIWDLLDRQQMRFVEPSQRPTV